MAQFVKLEPGDILVLANIGPRAEEMATYGTLEWLKEKLQLGNILIFEGDVDLSSQPAGWTPDAVAGA